MLNVHCLAGANLVFVANRKQGWRRYLGRSWVVDATGGVRALADATEEGVIGAEADLERASRQKRLADTSHALGDRNPAVYASREDDR